MFLRAGVGRLVEHPPRSQSAVAKPPREDGVESPGHMTNKLGTSRMCGIPVEDLVPCAVCGPFVGQCRDRSLSDCGGGDGWT